MPLQLAAMRLHLTKKMKAKRMKFAKTYQNFTFEDLANVIFSDESTFRCIRACRNRVRRPKGPSRFELLHRQYSQAP
jgi:hypothetical protein